MKRNITKAFQLIIFIVFIFANVSCNEQARTERKEKKMDRREARHQKRNALSGKYFNFRLDEHPYEICYVSEGKLYFYDINTNDTVRFPEVKPIFNFAFSEDESSMFYTIVKNDSLVLKEARFHESQVEILKLTALGKPVSYFSSMTNKKGKMIVEADSVYLECNYIPEQEGFSASLKCIVSDEYVQLTAGNFFERRMDEYESMQEEEDAKFMKDVIRLKMNGFSDLFMMANKQAVQETSTELQHQSNTLSIKREESDIPLVIHKKVDYFVMR